MINTILLDIVIQKREVNHYQVIHHHTQLLLHQVNHLLDQNLNIVRNSKNRKPSSSSSDYESSNKLKKSSKNKLRNLSKDKSRNLSKERSRNLSKERSRNLSKERSRNLSKERSRNLSKDKFKDKNRSKSFKMENYEDWIDDDKVYSDKTERCIDPILVRPLSKERQELKNNRLMETARHDNKGSIQDLVDGVITSRYRQTNFNANNSKYNNFDDNYDSRQKKRYRSDRDHSADSRDYNKRKFDKNRRNFDEKEKKRKEMLNYGQWRESKK